LSAANWVSEQCSSCWIFTEQWGRLGLREFWREKLGCSREGTDWEHALEVLGAGAGQMEDNENAASWDWGALRDLAGMPSAFSPLSRTLFLAERLHSADTLTHRNRPDGRVCQIYSS
jgi:hypothetical protein